MSLDKVRPWQRPAANEHVRHACPECTIGAARASCWVCGGHGAVSEARLGEWQRVINRTAAL